MKRFMALMILLCLCVSMAGCNVLDYAKATRLYENEEYAQALELYQGLGDFADSERMALLCSQKTDYAAAGRYFGNERYEQALALYEGLGMYADSPIKAISCRYELGIQSFADEDYEKAIFWLGPLGSYEDSAQIANVARWQWLRQDDHTFVIEQTPDSYRALFAGPAEEDALYLYLENSGMLMGIAYELEFVLILESGWDEAEYWVRYASMGETGIEEEAGGTVSLESFRSGGAMEVAYFQQWIDAWGESDYSDDVADSSVIQSVLADAQAQVMTYLPELLEETGVDISPEDLGL